MKIIAEYDPKNQKIIDDDGVEWFVVGAKLTTVYKEQQSNTAQNVIELTKLGMSAEDILKLKHGGAI